MIPSSKQTLPNIKVVAIRHGFLRKCIFTKYLAQRVCARKTGKNLYARSFLVKIKTQKIKRGALSVICDRKSQGAVGKPLGNFSYIKR